MLPFSLEKGFTVDMYGYLLTVHTAASLLAVTVLGIVKLKPKVRFWVMALGFSLAVVFLILSYLSKDFMAMCVLFFLASLLNTAGNAILNASLTLALPASNRGAILGFLQSASVGGVALSALLYGVLGDVFPLYIVFAMGSAVSLAPMLYMCFHRDVKIFILNN
jgi:MFS family permease